LRTGTKHPVRDVPVRAVRQQCRSRECGQSVHVTFRASCGCVKRTTGRSSRRSDRFRSGSCLAQTAAVAGFHRSSTQGFQRYRRRSEYFLSSSITGNRAEDRSARYSLQSEGRHSLGQQTIRSHLCRSKRDTQATSSEPNPACRRSSKNVFFLNGRRIRQHHPRRRRNHPSDYPCAWRVLTTSLQPMAALV
jgi:hypothetical protein